MSTKIRALLWEELRTGGIIAAWCSLVGFLCLSFIRLNLPGDKWDYTSAPAMALTFGTNLTIVLLLLYRTGNSGGLTGGFSGRILLLPIETSHAVGVILMLRGLLVFAASVASFSGCRLLFGHGPLWVFCLLLPALYLLVQGLDWLRRSMPLVAVLGFVALLVSLAGAYLGVTRVMGSFHGSGAIEYVLYSLEDVFISTKPFPLSVPGAAVLLALSAAMVYGVSIVGVNLSRRGERRRKLRFALPDAVPLPGLSGLHGFRSARWAQLWWFLRKDGALLPAVAAAVGVVVVVGIFAVTYFRWTPEAQSKFPVYGNDPQASMRFPLFTLEWAVWPVLLVAITLWGGLRGGAGLQRGVRPSLTETLYPMSAADQTVVRLWGHAIVLGVTWLIALIISNAAFLLSDHALAWRIYADGWAAGETNLREILESRLLLPIVILLAAWALMALRTRLVACFFWVLFLFGCIEGMSFDTLPRSGMEWEVYLCLLGFLFVVVGGAALWMVRRGWIRPWHGAVVLITSLLATIPPVTNRSAIACTQWALVALILALTSAALIWAWRRGLIPRRHLVGCAAAWVLMTLFAYPFGYWQLSGMDRQSLFMATAFGALLVFPYPALLIDLHRRRHGDDTPEAPSDHDAATTWGFSPRARAVLGVALAVLCLATVWLRWPAKPVYIETLRAQGQPATLADLAAYYGPAPVEENAAPHYDAVLRDFQQRDRIWSESIQSRKTEASDREWELLYGPRGNLVEGAVDVRPDEAIWDQAWDLALERYREVDGPVAEALEKVAAAEYPYCHYPLDLGSGAMVSVSHLASLRALARTQAFSIWVAAVEDRPDDVVRILKAMGPVAEAVRDEPILISQLVRIAIHGIEVTAAEQALSRTQFSEQQLAEMQHYLQTVLPPGEEQSMFARAMIGERVFSSGATLDELGIDYGFNVGGMLYQQSFPAYSRLVMLRSFDEMIRNTGNTYTPMLREIDNTANPNYILPRLLLPALDRAREAEWRCRVSLDMAAAACAVERYRLAHGALPETLDELVPAFMESVAADPFRDDGGPISYRVVDDGGYMLYSWAMNRTDEGGVHQDQDAHGLRQGRSVKKGNDWANGDWIFGVTPPSFRDGPQITDVPPENDH